MLSVLTSILKIVLGSLIANYFRSPFAGGWWAGVMLLLTSITGICSFTGLLIGFNTLFNALSLFVSAYAVIADSFLADYFSFAYGHCNFQDENIACWCEASKRQFENIDYYIRDGNCNNVFVRNPQLLIVNAALSALCFFSSLIMFLLLCAALGCRLFYRSTSRPGTLSDYTITV